MRINARNITKVLFASSCLVGAGALVVMAVATVGELTKR